MMNEISQAVVLAGGQGTRMGSQESQIPKPLLKAGERTLLESVIRTYFAVGVRDVVVLGGFQVQKIIDYVSSPVFWGRGVCISIDGHRLIGQPRYPDLEVTVLDTGDLTNTGGRVLRATEFLDERFYLTYGDGLSDLDVRKVARQHEVSQNAATITVVRSGQRYGVVELDGQLVREFREKSKMDGDLINAGYMVFNKLALHGMTGDTLSLEGDILTVLAENGQLGSYFHDGFWMAADTSKELTVLGDFVSSGALERSFDV